MSEQRNGFVMWSILICLVIITLSLLIIASKPIPQLSVSNPLFPQQSPRDEIIQLGSNRIAVADVSQSSGDYGRIAVFDYDDKNSTFKLVGEFNYLKDFRYRQPPEPTPTTIEGKTGEKTIIFPSPTVTST